MSIDLPRSIKIGPVMFSLERVECIGRDKSTWAEINYRQPRIKLKEARAVQHQAVSLMHEIVHAAIWTYGAHGLNDDEKFVEGISGLLLDTLWNSPGLLRYLREAKKT